MNDELDQQPDDQNGRGDDRQWLEVAEGIDWLLEVPVTMTGWRTTAAGYGGSMDHPVYPS